MIGRVWDAWTRWWHASPDPHQVAALRIAMGVLVALVFLTQLPYVELFWGDQGLVPRRVARAILDADEGSLLFLLPRGDGWLWACYVTAVVQGLLLAVGFKPNLQAACLFVWLVSFQNRNVAVVDGEDGVFRFFMFYLIFLPLGHAWSVDAWLRRRRGRPMPSLGSGWALRFVQIQTAFVFFVAGLEKLPGPMWWDGSALQAVMHLDDLYGHLPVPAFIEDSLLASKLMSWGTLVLEVTLPITVFLPRTRRLSIALAVAFHLALEWMMNLLFFEWVMIVGWLTHLHWQEDLAWVRSWWSRRTEAETPAESAA